MKDYQAGFVGCGQMGFALSGAVAKAEGAGAVILSCRREANAREKAAQLGCDFGNAKLVAESSRFVFLAVKPQQLLTIAEEVGDILKKRGGNYVLVSMLAGVSLKTLRHLFGTRKIIRIMPNTPVAVGEGMTLMCTSDDVTKDEREAFLGMMRFSGAVDELAEEQMDAASALSGCGPAFCYRFAEALSEGALAAGLPKNKALAYAFQTLLGSARLAKESGKHPAQLADEVTSPGGSTIRGLSVLARGGFEGLVMEAVEAAFLRTKELGHEKKEQ